MLEVLGDNNLGTAMPVAGGLLGNFTKQAEVGKEETSTNFVVARVLGRSKKRTSNSFASILNDLASNGFGDILAQKQDILGPIGLNHMGSVVLPRGIHDALVVLCGHFVGIAVILLAGFLIPTPFLLTALINGTRTDICH